MLKSGFDVANKLVVHGWGFDTEHSDDLELEIYLNDEYLDSVYANQDFIHLQEIKKIAGARGFAYKINEKKLKSGINVIRVVSKFHQTCLPFSKSPTMDHLPFFVGEKDFLAIADFDKIENGVQKIISKVPAYSADFISYVENRLQLAPEEVDVLFINGLPNNMSSHYRVHTVSELLAKNEYSTFSVTVELLAQAKKKFKKIGTIVAFRCPYSSSILDFIEEYKRLGAKIVYDIDDLIFREDILSQIDGYRRLSKIDRANYLIGVRAYRLLMSHADYATASTDYLLENMRNFIPEGSRIPNLINDESLRICSETYNSKISEEVDKDDFVIGYYSGTATHQNDFQIVSRAIAKTMAENPNVLLRIVGELDLNEFEEISKYKSRIKKLPLIKYKDMLKDFQHIDLAIAPLELNNEFCEAKSELKFFEPAASGVPVICSATSSFKVATGNGKYGVICETEEQWVRAFRKLIRNKEASRKMIVSARQHVLENYTTSGYDVSSLSRAYQRCAEMKPKTNSIQEKLKNILVVIPGVFSGSGGLRKIFTFVEYISRMKGYKCTILSLGNMSAADVEYEISKNYFPLKANFVDSLDLSSSYASIVCTHWTTADFVSKNISDTSNVHYFIQDYEPYFEAAGYDFVKALETYKNGFKHIYFGPWVGKYIKSSLGISGADVGFPIDKDIYYPSKTAPTITGRVKIIVYSKPSQKRRAFELIQDVFREVQDISHLFTLTTYGDNIPEEAFPFQFVNMGPVNDPESLAEMYRKSDLGISLSTTNPSLVGYEMLACGLPIMDLDIPLASENYNSIKSALMMRPLSRDFSKSLREILLNKSSLVNLKKDAIKFGSGLCTTEEEFGKKIFELVSVADPLPVRAVKKVRAKK